MKKLINDVAAVVPELLSGLAVLNPGLAVLPGRNVVVRADARDPAVLAQVALVSGGGAGHEPAHGGYVGPGMLTAAVVGEVFTSPSTDAVLDAIRAVAGPPGVLLIVKNYTGDRLNFGLAAELARAEGIAVELVVVADDVALSADGPHAGRRGLAGTVLVHKVAGAAAAAGRPLAEVAQLARSAAGSVATMGVALGSCTVPAAGRPGFTLGDDEIEWGLGIHGEPGVRRTAIRPADEIVAELLDVILGDLSLPAGSRVALLVNDLGGTSVSELSIVAGSALRRLRCQGLVVERAWAGAFLTALEMPGCSLSVLALDDERLAALDGPTRTSAWPAQLGRVASEPGTLTAVDEPEVASVRQPAPPTGPAVDARLGDAVRAVCARLTAAEHELTELDARVGDGDLGISLARASAAVVEELDAAGSAPPGELLRRMSVTVARVMGGTSGPLYAVLLLRAAAALEEAGASDPVAWSRAFTAGVDGVRELGGAEVGDRTMVDALQPAAVALAQGLASPAVAGEEAREPLEALTAAVVAAQTGAAGTADLTARLGRSSYLGERARGVPDPGAHAVALWLAAVRDQLAPAVD